MSKKKKVGRIAKTDTYQSLLEWVEKIEEAFTEISFILDTKLPFKEKEFLQKEIFTAIKKTLNDYYEADFDTVKNYLEMRIREEVIRDLEERGIKMDKAWRLKQLIWG